MNDTPNLSDQAIHESNVERVLRDMDSFSNWFAIQCMDQFLYKYHDPMGHVREIERDYEKAKQRSVAELQFLLFTMPSARVIKACRDEIVERYMESSK